MKKAFTLVEVLLSISLITLLAAISVPFFLSFQYRTELDAAEITVVRAIRTAQQNAKAAINDDTWSVNIANGQAIVYRGSNFGARDTNYDIPYLYPNRVQISGTTGYTFTKKTGTPTSTGATTLSISGDSVNITVNGQGAITN